jgi:hypothetical protein
MKKKLSLTFIQLLIIENIKNIKKKEKEESYLKVFPSLKRGQKNMNKSLNK